MSSFWRVCRIKLRSTTISRWKIESRRVYVIEWMLYQSMEGRAESEASVSQMEGAESRRES